MPKDLFSEQAGDYARYRPSYPAALIDYILSFVPERKMAWDCATGNGQAALLLAPHFEKLMATDISAAQLARAAPHPAIEYRVCPAEKTPFADNSFDLITIAQAYHWFRFDSFHDEALRVAKPGAVIAAWTYTLASCSDQGVDAEIRRFYKEVTGPYWDAERKFVDEGYATVPFPYDPLPAREFFIDKEWTREDLYGFLNTWSALRHFIKANGFNPTDPFIAGLAARWPGTTRPLRFRFPLFLRLGRIGK